MIRLSGFDNFTIPNDEMQCGFNTKDDKAHFKKVYMENLVVERVG